MASWQFGSPITDETLNAIRAWQKKYKFKADGVLSEAQLKILRAQVPSKSWAVVAYSVYGIGSAAATSRKEAEQNAKQDCMKTSDFKQNCEIVRVKDGQCVGLASGSGRVNGPNWTLQSFKVFRGATLAQVEAGIVATCGRIDGCELATKICSPKSKAANAG
jgi:Domain of unknown function (DUF4189)